MKFKNIMKHSLGLIPTSNKNRSTFDRTCRYSTTANAGLLIPIYCEEIYPGDDVNITTHMMARLNTPVVPFMNNVNIDKHWFFVPNRLVWDNFQKFVGEKADPDDSTDYLIPKITAPAGGFGVHSLADYFGLPQNVTGIKVSALPFRGYNLIYNEWYRHEKLIDSIPVEKGDSGDLLANYVLRRRSKRRDYFTSCLPSPQEGPAIDVPLGTSAPVIGTGMTLGLNNGTTNVGLSQTSDSTGFVGRSTAYGTSVGNTTSTTASGGIKTFGVTTDGTKSGVKADLSEASAATINQWREAFSFQRIAEKLMRGGNRYVEQLKYRWGVDPKDARLQRPEFLGSESDFVQINQIAQTSSTDTETPQGNLSAYSYGLYRGQRAIKRSFCEHGYIFCIASIRADLMYQQGIPREWSRETVHDFLNPEYVHLGEQAVLNKEIYADGTVNDESVFGYMPRYDELRYGRSKVTGKLRSTDATPLDFWHLAQKFETRPLLNQTFIEENPPIERVVAVQNEPHFILDFAFDAKYTRVMPVYSEPGMIDHF